MIFSYPIHHLMFCEGCGQLELSYKHERLLDCQVRQQTVILTDIGRAGVDHRPGARYPIQVHLPSDSFWIRPARDDIQ